MDYDLDRLGWREMEHLTESLALRFLGNGVEVFGEGADGGREATFDGPLSFPEPDPGGPWNGYGVIQVKFRSRSRGRSDNVSWLTEVIRKEVKDWLDPESKRGRRPEYFLVVTNVVLAPKPDDGGIAKIEKLMQEEVVPALNLKGWRVWHYDTVNRFLDNASDIAKRYYGLITPGDVLARLHDYVEGLAPELGDTLIAHAAKELLAEQHVSLGQAGDHEDRALALNRVAVDLPASIDEVDASDVNVVAHVIERGERSLRRETDPEVRSQLVILGGPGQGKTTLAQLICQAYRVTQLQDLPDHRLIPEVRALRDEFTGNLIGNMGIELPGMRRWPFHIRLDRYADAIAKDPDLTLLRYIADRVGRNTTRTVTDAQMAEWLGRWPWVLVLDGLDEVSDPQVREPLLRHIQEFRTEAALRDADLLLVATTRPQGYAEEFVPDQYDYLRLRSLRPDEAVHYAERLAAARHPADSEKEAEMLQRIRDAAGEEQTSRLMRSPLQVTIMALLLERRRRPPQHRFGLFKGYYDTVFAREVAKRTGDAQLLEGHQTHIHALQAEAGLLLQARSEREGDAEATLSEYDLRALSAQLLRDEGYDADTVDTLSGRLVGLASRRLVLLVHRPDGGVGFEVRSLQEFMAARALLAGTETDIISCLTTIAPSDHWRNTWLFAAGEVFAERAQLRDAILTHLKAVDHQDVVSLTVLPAAHLAVDLLEENIADTSPKFQSLLTDYALELLRRLPDLHLVKLAGVVADVVERNAATEEVVARAITDAFAASGPPALSALMVCAVWAGGTGRLARRARDWLEQGRNDLAQADSRRRAAVAGLAVTFPLAHLRGFELTSVSSRRRESIEPALSNLLKHGGLRSEDLQLARTVVDTVGTAKVERSHWPDGGLDVVRADRSYRPDLSKLSVALDNPRVAAAFVAAADDVELVNWPVAALMRQVLALWSLRRPVADLLPRVDISGF
ncbi:NACHT domain-containing protein [Nonomuraea sp. NPDC005983]|uniref:NACHT domain-containing protein n=1 Tax=Nonomuraea sp. NPDC005983 TaxID=3155595 RepID=UPI0033B72ABA